EATQGDKDSIGHFAIGLNPKIELIGYPSDELALGTATIGIGANKGNGGLNDSSFEFSGTLTKPTIDIDGTALMVDGRLVLYLLRPVPDPMPAPEEGSSVRH